MKVLGIKTIKLSKLTLPGNWKAILKRPSAAARGKSIAEVGCIHDPIVRKVDGGYTLVAGRDRVAGMEIEGMEEITVKLVECTDDEAADIEELENIERRHDKDEIKKIRAKRLERLTAIEAAKDHPKPKRGRPKKPETRAREIEAERRKVKPRSVEQAERRRKKKEEEEAIAAGLIEAAEAEPCIKLLGMELDAPDLEKVAKVQELLTKASSMLTASAMALGTLAGAELPVPAGPLDRLRQAVKECSATTRAMVPTTLCPYCKMVEGAMEQCAACSTVGWLGDTDGLQVPEVLWDEDNPVVVIQGEVVPMSDLFGEEDDDELEIG